MSISRLLEPTVTLISSLIPVVVSTSESVDSVPPLFFGEILYAFGKFVNCTLYVPANKSLKIYVPLAFVTVLFSSFPSLRRVTLIPSAPCSSLS